MCGIQMDLPVFPLRLRCSIGAALAILGGHIAALFVWSTLVLQNVFEAEVQALQTGLGARSLGKGTGLRLLRTGRLGNPVPTGRQNVETYPVHCKSAAQFR